MTNYLDRKVIFHGVSFNFIGQQNAVEKETPAPSDTGSGLSIKKRKGGNQMPICSRNPGITFLKKPLK